MKRTHVLSALQNLSAQDVYALGPPEYYYRGHNYYLQHRVMDYSWNVPDGLTVLVRGTKSYRVGITVKAGVLHYTCTCPAWGARSNCKHVICAVLTTIHLQDETRFQPPRRYSRLDTHTLAYTQRLQQRLMSGAPRSARQEGARRLALIIGTSPFSGLNIRLAYENHLKTPLYEWEINDPPLLAWLYELRMLGSHHDPISAQRVERSIWDFINRHYDTYVWYYEVHNRVFPIKEVLSAPLSQKLELAAENDRVRLTRTLWHKDTRIETYSSDHLLVFLPEQAQLGIISISPIVELFDRDFFDRAINIFPEEEDNWLTVEENTVTVFRSYFLENVPEFPTAALPEIKAGMVCVYDGRPTMLQELPVERVIALTLSGDTQEFTLVPSYRHGKERIPCIGRPFLRVLEQVRDRAYPHLRAKKQWTAFLRTFAAAMLAPTETDAQVIMTNALKNDTELVIPGFKRPVKKALTTLYRRVTADSSCRITLTDKGWGYIVNDLARVARMWSVLYLATDNAFKLTNALMTGRVHLSAAAVYRHIAVLCSLAASQGVSVVMGDKPVEMAALSVSINATKNNEVIDWFELHPEVTCNGLRLTHAEWKKILSGQFLLDGDTIRVLDTRSQDIMTALQALLAAPGERSGKAGKNTIAVNRLQIFDWLALRSKGVALHLPAEYQEIISRLEGFSRIPKAVVPARLHRIMRPYQRDGVSWLAFLYRHRFGACLADDMGVGKTLQVIALIAGIKAGSIPVLKGYKKIPHLIVVPPSLLFNWQHEVARFAPELKVHEYTGNSRTRSFMGVDIVLSTYDIMRRDIEHFKKLRFHSIVFDEAQSVKNIRAARTGAMRQLTGGFRICLTGTPVENHIGEYFSIIDLAIPGLLGEYRAFLARAKREPPQEAVRKTKLFVLRRTKDTVLKDLPLKQESDMYLGMNEVQKEYYTRMVSEVREEVARAFNIKPQAQAGIIALAAILRLRQICISPALLDPKNKEPSPKFKYLEEKLREIISEGNAALVFSQFTSVLDLLEPVLQQASVPYVRLDGSTPVQKRKDLVAAFKAADGPPVFLISLKAGGFGLNLTRASYVFLLDPWWNPAVEQQAADRVHRIGQKNKVMVQRLLMHQTIEEKMMLLKARKKDLYQQIMAGTARTAGALKKEDIDLLLQG